MQGAQTFHGLDLNPLTLSREDNLLPKSQAVLSFQAKTTNKKKNTEHLMLCGNIFLLGLLLQSINMLRLLSLVPLGAVQSPWAAL